MTLQDLFITPAVFAFMLAFLYWLRPYMTNEQTKQYFLPAFICKAVGAITLGVLYQFYYKGGDTYNFFFHSELIFDAALESPWKALQLIFMPVDPNNADLYAYTSKMYWYKTDAQSYMIARFSGFFGLFTFNTYSSIALCFALLSFFGVWAMFLVFVSINKYLTKHAAIACFFIPSVFFWGSGLMKDTLTIAGMGFYVYGFYFGLIKPRYLLLSLAFLLLGALLLIKIKLYVLIALVPASMVWLVIAWRSRIPSHFLRIISVPIIVAVSGVQTVYLTSQISELDERFKLDQMLETAAVTADYLHRTAQKEQGSVYYIGEVDGSLASTLRILPAATAVTLFEPYLWQVRNPIMLLSSLESMVIMFLMLYTFFKYGFIQTWRAIFMRKELLFCLVVILILAPAVGFTSQNYGTLARYKIPLMPFLIFLIYSARFEVIAHTLRKAKIG